MFRILFGKHEVKIKFVIDFARICGVFLEKSIDKLRRQAPAIKFSKFVTAQQTVLRART